MAKSFRDWNCDQCVFLSFSVRDFVRYGHFAHCIQDFGFFAILNIDTEEKGYRPYHPVKGVARLPYGYCQGLYSAQGIVRARCKGPTSWRSPP